MRNCLLCGVREDTAEYARCLVEMMKYGMQIDSISKIPKMKEQTHVWVDAPVREKPFYGRGIVEMLSEAATKFRGPLVCGCGDKCNGHPG